MKSVNLSNYSSMIPCNEIWLDRYILQPFKEGSVRIERAWAGQEIHALIHTPLSLKKRIISLIQGVTLMLPLINSIVWFSIQFFGVEPLTDPYAPPLPDDDCPSIADSEETKKSNPEPIPPAPNLEPIRNENREFSFLEYEELFEKDSCSSVWTKIISKTETTIRKVSPHQSSLGLYSERELQSIAIEHTQSLKFDRKNDQIRITKENAEVKTYPAPLGLWIQQPIFVFQDFALDPTQQQLPCFSIDPKNFDLIESVAKKKGIEKTQFGELLKIEIKPKLSFPKSTTSFKTDIQQALSLVQKSATLWVDPQTGICKKSESKNFAPFTTETWIPSDPLPESEHL